MLFEYVKFLDGELFLEVWRDGALYTASLRPSRMSSSRPVTGRTNGSGENRRRFRRDESGPFRLTSPDEQATASSPDSGDRFSSRVGSDAFGSSA
jgi:hypothetical protein